MKTATTDDGNSHLSWVRTIPMFLALALASLQIVSFVLACLFTLVRH